MRILDDRHFARSRRDASVFHFSCEFLGAGARRAAIQRRAPIIAMKIVAPGQMSHGDKGLTAGWREMHRTCAPVRRVNPKIHYCSLRRGAIVP